VHQPQLPIKHKLKDSELLKRMLGQPSKRKGANHDKEAPKEHGASSKDGNTFPNPDGNLMIIGGPKDDCTKRHTRSALGRFAPPRALFPSFSVGRALQSPSIGVTTLPMFPDRGATLSLSTPNKAPLQGANGRG
jgi:hypothetical protein